MQVHELVVYGSVGENRSTVHARITEALTHDMSCAVFFSPLCASTSADCVRAVAPHLRLGAIGSTTAAAMRRLGCPPDFVADAPNPEALLRAAFANEFSARGE